MNQELRQAAAQAKEALTAVQAVILTAEDKWDESWPAKVDAALSALSAVLEAPTLEARSGSGVPARPTLPGEDAKSLPDIAEQFLRYPVVVKQDGEYADDPATLFAFTAHGFDTDLTPFYCAAQMKDAMLAALAASPLPQEGCAPLTDEQIWSLHDGYLNPVEFARAIEAAHGIAIAGTQGEQKP